MRTDDGGTSFSDHRPEAARDVHCLAWHPSAAGRACEAGGDGTAWSRDGGRSWDRADAGRERGVDGPLEAHVYALATAPGKLFAGLADGTIRQSDDGGDGWSDVGERIGRITALAVK